METGRGVLSHTDTKGWDGQDLLQLWAPALHTLPRGGGVRRWYKDGGFCMITMTLRQKIRDCGQCQKEKTPGWLSMVVNVCGRST